ncbi:MAG: aminopeptidase P family N-terminal domain-containing protein, partial [Evtepia sp.]
MRKPIEALRVEMKARQIDAYLVPGSDFHASEYVAAHFACREFLSGFTGSAGTLLVLSDFAGLWTDGRYFLQAEQELIGSGITLMKQGYDPTIETFLTSRLRAGACLAFDGRCITAYTAEHWKALGFSIKSDLDLVGAIWTDRPPLSAAPAYELDLCFAGVSRADKIAD